MAAGAGYAGASLGAACMLAVIVMRHFEWRPRPRGPVVWLLASLAFAGVFSALPHQPRVPLFLAAAVALAAYLLVSMFGLLQPGDVLTLRGVIPLGRRRRAPERLDLDGGVSVVCHRGTAAIAGARASWEDVFLRAPGAEPFQHPAWAEAWTGVYGHGREPLIVEVRQGAVPVGVLALQVTTVPVVFTRRLEFLTGGPPTWRQWALDPGGLGSAYTNGALAAPGCEAAVMAGLHAWLEAAREEWDVLRWTNVRSADPLLHLFDSVTEGCRRARVEQVRYAVDTTLRWPEYTALLSKRQRRHLRYEGPALARAAGGELRLEEQRGAAAVAGIEEFIDLHTRRWSAARKPGLHPGEADLYRAAVRGHPHAIVFRLVAAGRTLAMEWGFDNGRRYVLYNVAFDPELIRQSPANVLLEHVIRRCCDGDQVEVDLAGLGSASHWAVTEAPRTLLIAQRRGLGPSLRGQAFTLAGRTVRGAQSNRAGRRLRSLGAAAAGELRGRRRGHAGPETQPDERPAEADR